jgi:hypothetical protein
MELDDLKNAWNNAHSQAEKQNTLTTKMIDQMTQKKYYSKIKEITYPEIVGIAICLMATIYIGLNFYKLDSIFLQCVGALAILLLLVLSVISLLSLRQLNITGDVNKSYAETLRLFATQKIRFYKLQKINITLSYLLLVMVIILLTKFFNGRDITSNKYFWTLSFTVGYLFLLFYSKWVSKLYRKTLKQSEELLKELQS